MQFESAKRVPLSEMVLHQLLERLRDGSLRPGERLPSEDELTRMLGVGRSSVREALRVLVVMGLVETRAGRGAFVLRDPGTIFPGAGATPGIAAHLERMAALDLLEVREGIESQAAQLAAERATQDQLLEIERRAAAVEGQVMGGKTYFRANAAFHLAIAKATRNQAFVACLRQLLGRPNAFRERLMAEEKPMRQRDIREHRALVEAIKARDGARARLLATQHIGSSIEAVRRFGVGDAVEPIPRRRRQAKSTL